MFLAFSDFRGGGLFLKWKGHFSFWGSARKDIRTVWRDFQFARGQKVEGVGGRKLFACSPKNDEKIRLSIDLFRAT